MAPVRGGTRREVRAAVVIALAVAAAGALAGVGWGFLAPVEHLLVVEPGRGAPLTGESMHQFDAIGMFVLAGAALGLLSAAAAWRWRSVRGPVTQLGLLAGSGASAVAMMLLGEQVAQWRHPRPHHPAVGQIVALPTEVGSALALVVQPLVASFVVLFLVALNSSEDLGVGEGAAEDFATVGAAPYYVEGQFSSGRGEPVVEGGGALPEFPR